MPPMTKAAEDDTGVRQIRILALPFPICNMGGLALNMQSRNVKFMSPFSPKSMQLNP